MNDSLCKVQISLGEAGGFELVTNTSEADILKEIEQAKAEGRMARIGSSDPELSTCIFIPQLFCGLVMLPVRKNPLAGMPRGGPALT